MCLEDKNEIRWGDSFYPSWLTKKKNGIGLKMELVFHAALLTYRN